MRGEGVVLIVLTSLIGLAIAGYVVAGGAASLSSLLCWLELACSG